MSSGNGTGTDDPVTSPRSRERLEHGVELALHAPSVHNTQPWRWRIGDDHVDLFADRERHLPDTDPDGRDLFISCGAALHHLRVALAGFGLASATTRFPDPENRDHIATVRIVPGRQDPADSSLYPALRRRRTDRRRYGPGEVRQATLASLRDRAAGLGATLQPVLHPDVRARLDAVLAEAADAQLFRPGYVAELLTWTRRYADSHDGVPAASVPHRATRRADSRLRFPPGRLVDSSGYTPDGGILVALATAGDERADQVAAGEATSAVLLAATRAGLASAPLSQALELRETRRMVAEHALHIPEHPQMIIRLGVPPNDDELPETPRRPLSSVLLPGS